jgi:uncharacterized DUF497 family protein
LEYNVNFEWDARKAAQNLRKHHHVSFEDAARVFLDPHRIETYDGRDAYGEDRWKTVGMVDPALLAGRVHHATESGRCHPIDLSEEGRCL